jgi:hypothetical protein
MNNGRNQGGDAMPLPRAFCWTRYGAEAGQDFEAILARKERERRRNGGLFLWGIGNNVAPSLPSLFERARRPVLAFSPMKSRAQLHDENPDQIAVWTQATGANGEPFHIPSGSMVTSRYTAGKSRHYALVCKSQQPLRPVTEPEWISIGALSNVKTGNPVGASQVTAMVYLDPSRSQSGAIYPVAFYCELAAPYVLKLEAPLITSDFETAELEWSRNRASAVVGAPQQLCLAV